MKAIKFGLEYARTNSVLTCDIDDPFSFDYLENLQSDLNKQPAKTMITIPKQLFVDGKPNGQIWHIPKYEKPEQYIVAMFINHSGFIALNNTIHKRYTLLTACNEALALLKAIGVDRMDYGEDSLRASIMIQIGLISKIIPSRTYSVPYTYDNPDSQSKDDAKRMKDLPILIAYAHYYIYSQYSKKDIELKSSFKDENKQVCNDKYGDKSEWFMAKVEEYVERITAYYKQLT